MWVGRRGQEKAHDRARPRAEKRGLAALQGARETVLGQVPVLLLVAWAGRARQGLDGGLAGSWDSWIFFPLGYLAPLPDPS